MGQYLCVVMNDKNSIKNKIILSYSFLIGMIFFSGFTAYFYLQKSKILRDYDDKAENLQFILGELFQADQDFFRFSSIDTDFYQNKQSKELLIRKNLLEEVNRGIQGLLLKSHQEQDYQEQLHKISRYIFEYNLMMDTVIKEVLERGFKDYGIEGQMRYYAHWLEDSATFTHTSDLLMLRRHEKDYLIRKDNIYIKKFKKLSNFLLDKLPRSSTEYQQLKSYQENFFLLARHETEIGVDEESGMRKRINASREKIKSSLNQLLKYSNLMAIRIVEQGKVVFFMIIFGFLLIAVWLAIDIWKNTAKPLTNLTSMTDSYLQDPSHKSHISVNTEVKEITKLQSSFFQLIQDLEALIEQSKQANTELEEKNKKLTKINEELDMFVYSASHDLRAPMTSLMGLIQLCQSEGSQEECSTYYTFMEDRIKELDRYIMDILDYSRNNRQEMNIQPVDLESLLDETIQQYAYHENFKAIRIFKKINYLVPCVNDKLRISIIFKNLISNAIKYSDSLKRENILSITVEVSQEFIDMEFSDTGIGIPDDKKDKVFDIFYRAHAHSKGSGLGLYIVKETVDKIGGEIKVSSILGKGTVFNIRVKNYQHQTKPGLPVLVQ